jgi:GNAT superfamily N-acetyltransferase
VEIEYKEFLISDDRNKLQLDRVCEMPHTSYWAKDRAKDTIEKSITNSLCFGVYEQSRQVGFARCVSDFATVYWLADVIIDDDYRKMGLGKTLVEMVVKHKLLKSCFGILGTSDAHGLYEKYGFQLVDGRFMRKPAE